jgi:hypothetical protein
MLVSHVELKNLEEAIKEKIYWYQSLDAETSRPDRPYLNLLIDSTVFYSAKTLINMNAAQSGWKPVSINTIDQDFSVIDTIILKESVFAQENFSEYIGQFIVRNIQSLMNTEWLVSSTNVDTLVKELNTHGMLFEVVRADHDTEHEE